VATRPIGAQLNPESSSHKTPGIKKKLEAYEKKIGMVSNVLGVGTGFKPSDEGASGRNAKGQAT